MNKNILFIGDLNHGTRSLMRAENIKNMCHDFMALSNMPIPYLAGLNSPGMIERLFNKLRLPRDLNNINKSLSEIKTESRFDIIWIDKSPMIHVKTLLLLKNIFPKSKIISVSEDDMYALHNRSRYYEKCLPLYDFIFTTKVHNLTELKALGAKNTELFLDSYNAKLHRPMTQYLNIYDKDIDVSFIGTYEDARAKSILWLGQHNIKILVFGNGWAKLKNLNSNVVIQDKPIYGEEYVQIINRSRINLGFLRKLNRDQVTSRSMEITGSQGFLLAERTSRHVELFREGHEAEFFSTDQELLDKIYYYIQNPDEISKIAAAGRRRCTQSQYEMNDQIIKIIKKVS